MSFSGKGYTKGRKGPRTEAQRTKGRAGWRRKRKNYKHALLDLHVKDVTIVRRVYSECPIVLRCIHRSLWLTEKMNGNSGWHCSDGEERAPPNRGKHSFIFFTL